MGLNNEGADRIVLDIETVASPDCATLLDPVRAPANYKDPIKIAAYCEEKLVERIATAALEADLCEVVALGYCLEHDPSINVVSRDEQDEGEMLAQLWDVVGHRPVVGFNCLSFDLPVLIRRSQLLGVRYPDVNLDRYRTAHIDLLERLSFNGKLTYRSLAFYCRRFGITVADTTTGADIAALVAANQWPEIAAHCHADVEKTALLARRLGFIAPVLQEVA